MKLHLIGGFLGSGKTTAIVGAAKHLLAQGKRVGVITNDQGRFLVDTAFFRLADLPAVEVTGGCFCCNYDDLDARLEQIVAQARPDVVFAESVGSCADLVATVVKPLLSLGGGRFAPSSFSVFADARLLRRRLLGLEMPFSEDVVYIFDQQLQEAGLLVVNKADLLPAAALQELGGLVRERFPGYPALYQDSRLAGGPVQKEGGHTGPPLPLQGSAQQVGGDLREALCKGRVAPYMCGMSTTVQDFSDSSTGHAPLISGIPEWLERIEGGVLDLRLPQPSLEMDYARYGAGEAELAWLDEEIGLDGARVSPFIRHFLESLAASLGAVGAPVGHIKLLVCAGQAELKLSLTAGDPPTPAWAAGLPELAGPASLVLNARVQMAAQELRQRVAQALAAASQASGVTFSETSVSFFHPGFPRPTHRI